MPTDNAPGDAPVSAGDEAARLIDGLSTEQQRSAAEVAVKALPDEAKQDLAAIVVQSMDTQANQTAAANGVVEALPDEAKQDLAATVVRSIDSPTQQRAAAEGAVRSLSDEQRRQIVSALGSPDRTTRQILWYIVVSAMVGAIFVFGVMMFILVQSGKPAEAPLALATTALGGLVGLIATSPGSNG
jgi:hypothetical protein